MKSALSTTSAQTDKSRRREPQLWDRDLRIFREAYDLRYVRPDHLAALFGQSHVVGKTDSHLARRLRDLERAGYLGRREVLYRNNELSAGSPSTRVLAYHLARRGARVLEDTGDPLYRGLAQRDFKEETDHPFMKHELAVATVLVCFRLAYAKWRIPLRFTPYPLREDYKLRIPKDFTDVPKSVRGKVIQPDGYLESPYFYKDKTVTREDGSQAEVKDFLELDMGTVTNREKMCHKFARFLAVWKWYWMLEKSGKLTPNPLKGMRVLFIAPSISRLNFLMDCARRVSKRPWKGFRFALLCDFDLKNPGRSLDHIFLNAADDSRLSLVLGDKEEEQEWL